MKISLILVDYSLLVDERLFFKFRYKSLFFSGIYSILIGLKCCLWKEY